MGGAAVSEQYIQIPCNSAMIMDGVEHQCNKARGHTGDHRDSAVSEEGIVIELTWWEIPAGEEQP